MDSSATRSEGPAKGPAMANGQQPKRTVDNGLVPAIASSALLIVALFGAWPYGFYQFLRLVVCASSVYLGYRASKAQERGWMWTMWAIALLFNPFWPVRLSRQKWLAIDLLVAAVFVVRAALTRRH